MLQGDCPFQPKRTSFNLLGQQPLLDVKMRQCLIVTDNHFVTAVSKLWISNVYVRLAQTADGGAPQEQPQAVLVRTLGDAGGLWMTDVTLQGDGAREVQGVSADSSLVVEGSALPLHMTTGSLGATMAAQTLIHLIIQQIRCPPCRRRHIL